MTPIKKQCDICCSINVIYVPNARGSRPYYLCRDCNASVGCHIDRPTHALGRMATKRTRQLRTAAHNSFDAIWRNGYMDRFSAYDWLSRQLNVESKTCHISMLNDSQLIATIEICDTYLQVNRKALTRRASKQRDKFEKRKLQHELTVSQHIKRRKRK